MLSVPWFIGWTLRPYIAIETVNTSSDASKGADDKSLSAAKAQVAHLSSPSAARPVSITSPPRSPTSKSQYPVTTQPVKTKDDPQPKALPVSVPLTQTTAPKTATTPSANQKQAGQDRAGEPSHQSGRHVSVKTVGLKMSAEWAQQQLDKFRFSFDEADRDKSGSLSFDEVFTVVTRNGFKGSKDQAKELFALLDVNNDQKVSRQEFSAALNKLPRISIKEFILRKTFQQLDKDGSGSLTRREIEDATKADTGLDVPADKIAELLIVLSKDTKDDVVDYEEFLRVFGVQSTATVMEDIFIKLDTDHSGYLTKDEILLAVKAEFELKLRAAKISDLLIAWHKDTDKKINYHEFVQVWTKYK